MENTDKIAKPFLQSTVQTKAKKIWANNLQTAKNFREDG